MKILWIRHGMTKGNQEKRYIGRTQEPLSEEGIHELISNTTKWDYGSPSLVFSSPMIRCRQTADILYPEAEKILLTDYHECDFGDFEGKNYMELSTDPSYQQWLDSNGRLPFPNGESMTVFKKRCSNGYQEMLRLCQSKALSAKDVLIACVVHGGTIMAVLEQYCEEKKDYFEYQCKNGNGYLTETIDTQEGGIRLRCIQELQS